LWLRQSWPTLTEIYNETDVTPPSLLLVEDSTEDAALIVKGLAPAVAPEQIATCADGVAALDYLFCRGTEANRNPADLPRVVLLDLNLPRLPGLDVLREIRANERTRLLPVIVLSANSRPEDIRTAIRLGANSFVRKSGDFAEMSRAVELLARYWLDLNIPPPPERGGRGR
jgi:two-component system response regulator